MQIESVGLAHRLHSGLNRHLIPLPPVAGMATGDEVLPSGRPAAGAGHHVVQGQFTRGQQFAAVLAGITVTQKNVLARESTGLVRDAAILQQPND
jgi:hypothetical protein